MYDVRDTGGGQTRTGPHLFDLSSSLEECVQRVIQVESGWLLWCVGLCRYKLVNMKLVSSLRAKRA